MPSRKKTLLSLPRPRKLRETPFSKKELKRKFREELPMKIRISKEKTCTLKKKSFKVKSIISRKVLVSRKTKKKKLNSLSQWLRNSKDPNNWKLKSQKRQMN